MYHSQCSSAPLEWGEFAECRWDRWDNMRQKRKRTGTCIFDHIKNLNITKRKKIPSQV